MFNSDKPSVPSPVGGPTWEAAMLLPAQGDWHEADFFSLHTNRMAELVAGKLEVLPEPTWLHQLIVEFLYAALRECREIKRRGGKVLFAPLPIRLFPGTIREPDVLYVAPEHLPTDPRGYPQIADLVMEVVSDGDEARRRDYQQKRTDYARAGISEYWIVDPEQKLIQVLGLTGSAGTTEYELIGTFREGEVASGRFLPGFQVAVSDITALGKSLPQAE